MFIQNQAFQPNPMMMGYPSMGGMGMQMMMMSQMMNMMMTLMTSLVGMNQNGHMFSPLANFGGQGMPGHHGIGNFLGQGGGGGMPGYPAASGGSPGQAHSSAPTTGTQHSGQGSQLAANLTRQQAEDLVRKGGGKVNPGGKPTVLALRTKTEASRTYKDVFIVLKPDGSMQPFSANTRPSTSGHNRAMLKPGAYEISPRWRDGKYNNDAFLVKSAGGSMTVGVGRDANGDGVYSDKEMNSNYSSGQIRLHRGRGDRTSSTGCLNCKDYDGFLKAVGGRDSSFNLVLVNV